jgi:hypothetical protein
MSDGKWNIANLSVHGQAMFGDGNRMNVVVPAQNSVQIEALLRQLKDAAEAIPPAERVGIHATIRELAQELKKKRDEQDRGLLSRSIDRIASVLKLVPSAVSATGAVKAVLGL